MARSAARRHGAKQQARSQTAGHSGLQKVRAYGARHVQNFFGALGRLWRDPFSSAMTVAVIGIALAFPGVLHLLVTNGKALGGRWESAVDISVYLKHGVPAAEARALATRLESRADVASTVVILADAALEKFRESSGFGPALDALTENPLPSTLVVRPSENRSRPEDIDRLAADLRALAEADLVQIDTEWVRRFHAILDIVRRAILIASAMLAIAVIIIVGNTIRLDIQNRRDEIEVTKLIGASNGFIRRPFLYSGFWYGFVGGLLAVLLVNGTLALLQEPVQRIAGLYGSEFRLRGLDGNAALVVLATGTLLGWLGSWIAAARHMRRIEPG